MRNVYKGIEVAKGTILYLGYDGIVYRVYYYSKLPDYAQYIPTPLTSSYGSSTRGFVHLDTGIANDDIHASIDRSRKHQRV